MYLKRIFIGSIQVNIYFDKDDIYEPDDYFTLYDIQKYTIKQQFNVYVKDEDLNVQIENEIYNTDKLCVLNNDNYICIENPSNARCIYYRTYFDKRTNDSYIIYTRNYGLQEKVSILNSSQFIYAFLFFIQHKNYLILHSNLLKANKGILFCGQSGRGKTTIAKLFDQNGYSVITDETVLIEIEDNKIIGYGTPWAGREHLYFQNEFVEIDSLYIIEHSLTNILREEEDIYFVNYLLNQSYPFFYLKYSLITQISKIKKIISKLKNRYILGFVPNSSVCSFIETNV